MMKKTTDKMTNETISKTINKKQNLRRLKNADL